MTCLLYQAMVARWLLATCKGWPRHGLRAAQGSICLLAAVRRPRGPTRPEIPLQPAHPSAPVCATNATLLAATQARGVSASYSNKSIDI
jgi:hypothetical protein